MAMKEWMHADRNLELTTVSKSTARPQCPDTVWQPRRLRKAPGSGQHLGKESDGDGTDKIPIFPPPVDGCSPKPPESTYRPPPYNHPPHAVSECLSKEINIELTMYDDYQTL